MRLEKMLGMPEGFFETTSLVAYLQKSLKKDNTKEVFEGNISRLFEHYFGGDIIDMYIVISPEYGIKEEGTIPEEVGFCYSLEIKDRHKVLDEVELYSAPIERKNLLKLINIDSSKGKQFVLPGFSVYAAMAKLHGYEIGETGYKLQRISNVFDANDRQTAEDTLENVEELHREFMKTLVVFRSHTNGYGAPLVDVARDLKRLSTLHEAQQPF